MSTTITEFPTFLSMENIFEKMTNTTGQEKDKMNEKRTKNFILLKEAGVPHDQKRTDLSIGLVFGFRGFDCKPSPLQ